MMDKLTARGEALAAEAQAKTTRRVAQQLRSLLRGARISVDEAQVAISGRGIIETWLTQPELRFLSKLLK